jgi:hypothetical protein
VVAHFLVGYVLQSHIYSVYVFALGTRGSVVVKALCYKPEGRGFETR